MEYIAFSAFLHECIEKLYILIEYITNCKI